MGKIIIEGSESELKKVASIIRGFNVSLVNDEGNNLKSASAPVRKVVETTDDGLEETGKKKKKNKTQD